MAQQVSGKDVIGVVGLGDMGDAIVRCLLREELPALVYDIRPERVEMLAQLGASPAASLAELAANSDVISIVVLDDEQVRTVVREIFTTARPGTHIVVQSTTLPATVVDLAAEAAAYDLVVIDATVTGGGEKGRLGLLTVMVGGSDDAVKRCWPLFDAIGKDIFHVGGVGTGSTAKLINNLLSIGTYGLQLEAMQLGAAYGLDEDTITTIVSTGQGDSRGIRTWGRSDRLRRDPATKTPVIMYTKDLIDAALAGAAHGIVMPMVSVAASTMPTKIANRDSLLDSREPLPLIPRCPGCDQELAAPFRAAGRHPECQR